MQVLVDPSWRRLLVLGESGVYVINYMVLLLFFALYFLPLRTWCVMYFGSLALDID